MLPRNRYSFFAAIFALAFFAATTRADVKVGDSFPALTSSGLVNMAGDTVPDVNGKVTLVDFWASWCAPCKASFPAMAKLHEDYAARGLQIVAISIDEKPAAAVAFWKKMSPPFVALHDRDQKLVQQVVVPTMPTSYLLDRTGHVRFIRDGFHGGSDVEQLRHQIETLLSEKN
jgi:thiol-disulfide isomerase/thioredoxin